MNAAQSAQTQNAATDESVTASKPAGEGLAALWHTAVGSEWSSGDQYGRDAARDAHVHGNTGEHREKFIIAEPEANAGGMQATSGDVTTERVRENAGDNAHSEPPGVALLIPEDIEFVNEDTEGALEEWIRWCDDASNDLIDAPFYPRSLDRMADQSTEIVHAKDHQFIVELITNLAQYTKQTEPGIAEIFAETGLLERWKEYLSRRPVFDERQREALIREIDKRFPVTPHYHENQERFARPDFGSRVQLLVDRAHIFSGDAENFVAGLLPTLPIGWRESVVVGLRHGSNPTVCRLTRERRSYTETSALCQRLAKLTDGKPRFVAVESHAFETDEIRFIVPAKSQPSEATLEMMALPIKSVPSASNIDPTGVAPLDAVLATGGIPKGARVVVQAATAQAKTLLSLEVAEQLAARGKRVIWYATPDEPRESIQARRRQRLGVPRIDALNSLDETGLDNAGLFVVDGRQWAIEDVLGCEGVDVLVLDPVSKVRTRAPVSDPVTRVGHVLDLVEASGWTVWMTAPVVRGAGRRTQTERALGGARIEAGATLLLELNRSGAELAIHVVKSRLGGEGQEVNVRLDTERQRIVMPASVVPSQPVKERIWRDLQRELAQRGPTSAKALAEQIVRGKAPLIRDVIREQLSAGALVKVDNKVGLA